MLIPHFTRYIWAIGPSGSGKSTWAKELGLPILETGSWVRSWHHTEATTEELSFTTIECLGKDHRYFSKLIKFNLKKIDAKGVIVGVRNPIDFIDHFDPHLDGIVRFIGETKSEFEKEGLSAIDGIISFMLRTGIFNYSNYKSYDL